MPSFPRSGRLAVLSLCAVLAACSATDLTTAPGGQAAKGGGGGGGTPPGFYTGMWIQSPASVGILQDGTRQELSIEVDMTQSGSVIGGTARQYVSYYHPDGTSVVHISTGTPGRVSGTVTATGMTLGITRLGEPKRSYGFVLTLSADSTALLNLAPTNPLVTFGFRR